MVSSLDLLWALWKPNTFAYTTTYGSHDDPRVFKVDCGIIETTTSGEVYHVEGKYLDYDGKKFGYDRMVEEIPVFKGTKKITSLNCYPLEYHKSALQLFWDLIERGKKFVALAGVNYKSYQGTAYVMNSGSVARVNINGRVMVDRAMHRRINPNYKALRTLF